MFCILHRQEYALEPSPALFGLFAVAQCLFSRKNSDKTDEISVNFLLLRLCLTRIFSVQIDPTPCFCVFLNSLLKTKRITTIKCSNRPIGCPVMAIFVQEHLEKTSKILKKVRFWTHFFTFLVAQPQPMGRFQDFDFY